MGHSKCGPEHSHEYQNLLGLTVIKMKELRPIQLKQSPQKSAIEISHMSYSGTLARIKPQLDIGKDCRNSDRSKMPLKWF